MQNVSGLSISFLGEDLFVLNILHTSQKGGGVYPAVIQ